MKAIVVEIQGEYAIVLDKKGEFVKIKNNERFKVGHEVDLQVNAGFNINTFIKIASVAAVFILAVGLSFGGYSYYNYSQPYSYVDVDINPSIELTMNKYDKIVKMEGINQDGKTLLSNIENKNKDLKEGIEEIIKAATEKGYLKSNSQNVVMFAISSKDANKTVMIENNVKNAASGQLKAENLNDTNIVTEKVTLKNHDEAKKLGLSPGKLLVIERLKNLEPEKKVEDLKNLSMKDIVGAIKSAEEKKTDTSEGKVAEDIQKPNTGKKDDSKKADNNNSSENNNSDKNNNSSKNNNSNANSNKIADKNDQKKEEVKKPAPSPKNKWNYKWEKWYEEWINRWKSKDSPGKPSVNNKKETDIKKSNEPPFTIKDDKNNVNDKKESGKGEKDVGKEEKDTGKDNKNSNNLNKGSSAPNNKNWGNDHQKHYTHEQKGH